MKLRVVTYNLWHGLAPAVGPVHFRKLEPEERLKARIQGQHELLLNLKADVVLLQEVNPWCARQKALEQLLELKGFGQSDIVGVKVFGIGIPYHLNNGLVTLISPRLAPRDLGGVKLSGSKWSIERLRISAQVKETRYAKLVEFVSHYLGRVLVVNTHLHHGIEWDSSFSDKLKDMVSQKLITGAVALEIQHRMQKANERRSNEINALLEHLSPIVSNYDQVILGGDLNFTEGSESYRALRLFGFKDLALLAGQRALSFDRSANLANHLLQDEFPLSVSFEELSFDPKVRVEIEALVRQQERRPRRVDYLFLLSKDQELGPTSFELAGAVDPALGYAPSDHFALVSDLEAKGVM